MTYKEPTPEQLAVLRSDANYIQKDSGEWVLIGYPESMDMKGIKFGFGLGKRAIEFSESFDPERDALVWHEVEPPSEFRMRERSLLLAAEDGTNFYMREPYAGYMDDWVCWERNDGPIADFYWNGMRDGSTIEWQEFDGTIVAKYELIDYDPKTHKGTLRYLGGNR